MPSYRDFKGGLFLSGPAEQSPPDTLRRLVGTNPVLIAEIRSRDPDVLLTTAPDGQDIVSVVRFGDEIYFLTAAGNLYAYDGVNTTLIAAGFEGRRTSSVVMPPSPGAPDALFLANAIDGKLKKIFGGVAENWGIEPPIDGFAAAAILSNGVTLTSFAGVNPGLNAVTTLPMPMAVPLPVDLTQFQGIPPAEGVGLMSSLSDFITLENLFIHNSRSITGILVKIFTSEDHTSYYTRLLVPHINLPTFTASALEGRQILSTRNQLDILTGIPNPAPIATVQFEGFQVIDVPDDTISTVRIPKASFTGYNVNSDPNAGPLTDWSNGHAIFLIIITNNNTAADGVSIQLGAMALQGGYGIDGTVGYRITYRNSVSGVRSNPNPTEVRTTAIHRTAIELSGLPFTSPDPQVDQIEIWRTLSDGVNWFLEDQVPIATLLANGGVYTDIFSDTEDTNFKPPQPGLGTAGNTGAGDTSVTLSDATDTAFIVGALLTARLSLQDPTTHRQPVLITFNLAGVYVSREIVNTGPNYPGVNEFLMDEALDLTTTPAFTFTIPIPTLLDTALPLTNVVPEKEFNDVAGPINGRIWWLSSDAEKRGRGYYSAAGLPEALEGFIEVFNNTDPMEKLVYWNAALWIASQGQWFLIPETEPPYSFQTIYKAKGTTKPYTIAATTGGIFYYSGDGIRMFDGVQSQLVAFMQIATILRGRAAEGINAFVPDFAAAGPDEFLITQPSNACLGLRLSSGTWRNFGAVGLQLPTALYYDDRENRMLAGLGADLYSLEKAGAAEGLNIFEIQTPNILVGPNKLATVSSVYIEINSSGNDVTPVLIVDETEVTLPVLNTAERQVIEYPRTLNCRRFGIRLSSVHQGPLTLFGIDFDIAPGQGGAGGPS